MKLLDEYEKSFSRLTKDGPTSEVWLKLFDVKSHIAKLDNWQCYSLNKRCCIAIQCIFFLCENVQF